jgi:hypothetical protein
MKSILIIFLSALSCAAQFPTLNDATGVYFHPPGGTNGTVYTNVTAGVAGWWPFDAGSPTPDLSTNGNNGVLGGSPTMPRYVPGQITNALSFDGIFAIVQVNAAPVNAFPMSMTCWAQITNGSMSSGASGLLMGEIQLSSLDAVYLALENDSGQGGAQIRAVSQDSTGANSFDPYANFTFDSSFHFYAAVWSAANSCALYIDGTNVTISGNAGTGTPPSHTLMDHTFMGQIEYNGGSFFGAFAGNIDDVRIYPTAISSGLVNTIYTNGKAGHP